ncbi:hypothetical protein L3Y34_007301 [Caenorhabditis briggsae]|uniref:Uncharacterized protein n=1 Tax=Caenorhabditis briggsae TaxID=6238 RepID=A0AAE9A6G6_CAEBR|nr:hypothetical protein L3Y34_007301 [Caenorhabditis briggsae]
MTKFHVLNSLEYVVSLDNSNAIEIVGNRELVEISIPNLKRVQTNQKRWLQIQGNNEKLTDFVIEQDQFCKTLTNYNGENQFVSEIDGKICHQQNSGGSNFGIIRIKLPNLEYVASLRKQKPAIRLVANFNLTNFQLPKLKRVRAYQREWIRFEDKNDELMRNLKNQPQICLPHRDILNETILYEARIGDKYCGEF